MIASGTVRCGYFIWAPYFMKDPNTGALSGLNYDYMEEIGHLLGLKIVWAEEVSAGTAVAGLDAGRYDVMCTSLWPDDARLKNAVLTDPTYYTAVYAAVRKDETRFDRGSALDDPKATFVGIDGDITSKLPHEMFPHAKLLSLPETSDGTQLLQSIQAHKADVAFVDKGLLGSFNRANGDSLRLVPGPALRVFPETLGVKRGELEFAQMLNTTIRTINDSGRPAEFIRRYPGYEFFAPTPGWTTAPAH